MPYQSSDPTLYSQEQSFRSRWGLFILGLVITVILLLLALGAGGVFRPFILGALGCFIVAPAVFAIVATFWVIATRRAFSSEEPPRVVVARIVSPITMINETEKATTAKK